MSNNATPYSIHRRGLLLVMASPTAGGKTTIAKRLLAAEPKLRQSVSVTTRAPREGEVDGVDYHFVTQEKFKAMLDGGELLEHAVVHGMNHYGTPKAPVEKMLADGKDVLFAIDWQGAQQISEQMRQDLVSVFILPPTAAEMERRIRTRGQDDEHSIQKRLTNAIDEIGHAGEFGYIIINEDLEDAIGKVRAILHAERRRRRRQVGLTDYIIKLQDELKIRLGEIHG